MIKAIERIANKSLERLEVMGPRKGVAGCMCGHDRPFEAGENWICPVCFIVPPTHERVLENARIKGLREMRAASIEVHASEIEQRATKQRRKKGKHAA